MKKIILLLFVLAGFININGQIIKSGLVGYWSFSGNAKDSSVNNNHGTVTGATLTNDRFGNSNSAYYFDGDDDYIKIGMNSTLKPSSVTINVWFRNTDTTRQAYLLGCSNGDNGEWGVDIHQRKLLGMCSGMGAGSNNRYTGFRSGNWYTDSLWHMASFVYDVAKPLTCKMYLDAIDQGSPNISGSSGGFSGTDKMKYSAIDSWYFGVMSQYFSRPTSNNGPFYFKGDLDDGAIYNRALSSSEIKILYADSSQYISSVNAIKIPELTLYPNPTNDVVYIDCIEIPNVTVFNNIGEIVMAKKTSNKLKLSSLASGFYFVLVEVGEEYKSQVFRIVKQ